MGALRLEQDERRRGRGRRLTEHQIRDCQQRADRAELSLRPTIEPGRDAVGGGLAHSTMRALCRSLTVWHAPPCPHRSAGTCEAGSEVVASRHVRRPHAGQACLGLSTSREVRQLHRRLTRLLVRRRPPVALAAQDQRARLGVRRVCRLQSEKDMAVLHPIHLAAGHKTLQPTTHFDRRR
jgi:hypothetical protein